MRVPGAEELKRRPRKRRPITRGFSCTPRNDCRVTLGGAFLEVDAED